MRGPLRAIILYVKPLDMHRCSVVFEVVVEPRWFMVRVQWVKDMWQHRMAHLGLEAWFLTLESSGKRLYFLYFFLSYSKWPSLVTLETGVKRVFLSR